MNPPQVIVTGAFDDFRSRQLRLLEEAARLGEVNLLLWPDEAIQSLTGRPPKFPLAERRYFLEAVRYVQRVSVAEAQVNPDALPAERRQCGARHVLPRARHHPSCIHPSRTRRFSRTAVRPADARPPEGHRHWLL